MRKIIYYVASSLDGFICGENEDISGFVGEGDGVAKYLADLAGFDTVIMGRKTYEFGYKFGLQPGKTAYPHMTHYIFSDSLILHDPDPKVIVCPLKIDEVKKIRQQSGTDIYLCGGGKFAGWLLDHNQIDTLKIKLNPVVLGKGVCIFGDSNKNVGLELTGAEKYDKGLQIMTYRVVYHG